MCVVQQTLEEEQKDQHVVYSHCPCYHPIWLSHGSLILSTYNSLNGFTSTTLAPSLTSTGVTNIEVPEKAKITNIEAMLTKLSAMLGWKCFSYGE